MFLTLFLRMTCKTCCGIFVYYHSSYNPKHGIWDSKTWHLRSPKVTFQAPKGHLLKIRHT